MVRSCAALAALTLVVGCAADPTPTPDAAAQRDVPADLPRDVAAMDVPRDTPVPDVPRDVALTDADVVSADAPSDTGPADVAGDACAQTRCGADCVNTDTDPRHCGSCTRDCTALPGVDPASARCVAGACVLTGACVAGRGHCSADPVDGCEADLTSAAHCGDCATVCADPTGVCQPATAGSPARCVSGCSADTPDRCGGRCVSTRTDVSNCGACGTVCPTPPHGAPRCAAGACATTCDAGYHACGSACASNTDVATCGASCAPCVAPAHASATCNGTACGFTCDAGFGDCDGNAANGCEADLTAPSTCGACTTRCVAPMPLCGVGTGGARGCTNGCSGATPTLCAASCVDLATDPSFCGGCTTRCPAVANGRATCAASRCGFTCDAGFHACGGACVSNSAPANCGASCTPCPTPANATATCTAGACGFVCNTGFHLCGGVCVSDMATTSCGASCTPCPTVASATATCDGRSCGFACVSGTHVCGGACVLNTLVTSCGTSCTACATPTNGRATCDGTRCGVACNAGFHACGTACASDTDPSACGAGCAVCPTLANSAPTCATGVCGSTCLAGFGDCDGVASNGCETDLRTSATHCGACRNACPAWGVCVAGACPAVPLTAGRTVVTQFGYDDARTIANLTERTLTTANVNTLSFGRDTGFATSLDADVYGQPLYVPQVLVAGVRRDVLFVVTQSNAVYALNAATGATLWRATVGTPAVPLSTMYCGNIGPTTGIVGTPVIDPATWTIFVVAYTTADGGGTKRYRVHALDIATGLARPGYPALISPPAVGASRFDAEYANARGASGLYGGRLLVPFGGHYGDCGTYHGWIVGIDVLTPTTQTAWATPGSGAALWAPGGFSSTSGGRIYVATGNGFTSTSRGETVFALDLTTAGPTLTDVAANYFVPSDQTSLDAGDVDLGSMSPVLLPTHTGSSTPRLLFQSGKAGVAYLLNRDNLGGRGTGNGTTGEGVYSQAIFAGGVYGAAASFTDGSNVYVFAPGRGGRASPCTGSGGVMAMRLRTDVSGRSAFSPVWCSASAGNTSSPSVSANGTTNGILWMATISPSTLRAYSIADGREIYISTTGDAPVSVRQWVPPLVADGRVYVTGESALTAYRLR